MILIVGLKKKKRGSMVSGTMMLYRVWTRIAVEEELVLQTESQFPQPNSARMHIMFIPHNASA